MSIETRMRGAACQVKGITIWRTTDNRWQAAMTFDGVGWVVETDADMPAAVNRLLSRYGSEVSAIRARNTLTNAIRRLMCN